MISKKMAGALNRRINEELYSAYLYLSMAAHAMTLGLKGIASWFQVQVQEELFHAQKFYNYVLDQDAKIVLDAVAKPPITFKSAVDLFEQTLKHERGVTAAINKVVDLARQESDHATDTMLQWFVKEQVEEEATANDVLQQLKLIGNDGSGLFMIDRELATRTFTPPPPEYVIKRLTFA